jgi:hypothetical protein
MTLRTFVAPDGDEWRAWQVIPTLRLNDQLLGERRGQDVLAYDGPERRGPESPRANVADYVQPQLASGWLCFESDREKRRIAPPPAGWDSCSEAELADIWSRALPAPKIAPRPWISRKSAEAAPSADEPSSATNALTAADPLAAG